MRPLFARIVGLLAALLLIDLIFPDVANGTGLIWGALLLAVFYVILRPLLQVLILPLNIVMAGLLTPLSDALLVRWAAAWAPGLTLTFWQSLLAALLISLAYYPYVCWKQQRLRRLPAVSSSVN